MLVFASIAHRGSQQFIDTLVSNVVWAISPTRVCLFSHTFANNARVIHFREQDKNRHGTLDVLRRHMDCHAYIINHELYVSMELDVLVFVSANQRFFKPCHIQPQTLSFAPGFLTVSNNIINPFMRPIDYPSRQWSNTVGNLYNRLWGLEPPIIRQLSFLGSHNVSGWRRDLLMSMPSEGSFYSLQMLQQFKPLYMSMKDAYHQTKRTLRNYPEDWMIPTFTIQNTDRSVLANRSRPPLCMRLYLSKVYNISSFVHALQKKYTKHYCCFKIPGTEHVFGELTSDQSIGPWKGL